MMESRTITIQYAKIAALVFLWGSIGLILVAGIMLLDVYQVDVLPYVGYYIAIVGITVLLFALPTHAIIKGKTIKMVARVPLVFWGCVVIAASITGISVAFPKISMRYLATSPYLTWTDSQDPSNEITVSWITTFQTGSDVHYGSTRNSLDQTASGEALTRFHHVAVDGLSPNTTYYYQVPGHAIKQFTTAPEGTFNYTFVFWADHRTNSDYITSIVEHHQPNIIEGITAHLASEGIQAAFSVCGGDIAPNAHDYEGWNIWFTDIAYQDWAANQTLQVVFGNHERYGDPEKVIVQQHYPYEQKPDGHFYHSWDYGNVHFIAVDTYAGNHSWSWSGFTPEQLAWLDADLAAHQDANFTVMFSHPPPYGTVKTQLEQFAVQYGIDLYMCGHEHEFELTTRNGTSYMTIGLGGNQNNEYAAYDCDTAFVRLDVTATTLRVMTRFINETVLDDFTLVA